MAETPQDDGPWQKLAGAVSAAVAPVTLVTALLVYTAWTRTKTFFAFFGVDSSILGLSVQDYLLRSADTAFGVITWSCLGWATVVTVAQVAGGLRDKIDSSRRRWIRATVTWLALGCVLVGLLAAVWPALSSALTPYGASAILAGGAVVLCRPRPGLPFTGRSGRSDARRPLMLVAVVVAGFWAATVYARDLGTHEAENVDGDPTALAEVDLFSTKPLDIPGSLVSSSDVQVTPSTFSYRYVGLRLLEFSDDRWLVISGRRQGLHCSVLVLKDSDDIRVQIASPAP